MQIYIRYKSKTSKKIQLIQWRVSQMFIFVKLGCWSLCYWRRISNSICIVLCLGRHVPEMTAAANITGTTCWPFNFIHVRREGGRSHLSDRHLSHSATIQREKNRDNDVSNLIAATAPPHSHTHRGHKHPEHMVPSAKHRIDYKVDRRGGFLLQKFIAGEFTSYGNVCRLPLPPYPPVVHSR